MGSGARIDLSETKKPPTPAAHGKRPLSETGAWPPRAGGGHRGHRPPELFEWLQALGTSVRFHSVLPLRVREAEVLMAAVEQRSAFEWQADTRHEGGICPSCVPSVRPARLPNASATP